jgi:septum formation protein
MAPSAPRLILASGSPRRQELLRDAGYPFLVSPADIDESNYPPHFSPAEIAGHLALAKARAVAERFPNDVVLAADTVVALGSQALGKPVDAADARRLLSLLGGTAHEVITGVAVVHAAVNLTLQACVTSAVHMRALTAAEVDAYIATGDWQGKAGGYGIQDQDPFVTRTSGCHTNIVGLPMTHTRHLLAQAGITPQSQT